MCEHYRDAMIVRDEAPDTALDAHLRACPDCRTYATRMKTFDAGVKSAILAPVPDELSARLLALVPGLAAPVIVRSRRWQLQRRALMAISAILVAVSLGLLLYGLTLLGGYLGLGEVWAAISAWPGAAADWLYQTIPSSRDVVAAFEMVREPLQWTVMAILVWMGIDRIPARQEWAQSRS